MTKVEALKKLAVTLGYGDDVSDYTGKTISKVLKEIAVNMGLATSTKDIQTNSIVGVLNFIADNYEEEEEG